MEFKVDEIIADRVLQVKYADGKTSAAVVYLGKSRPIPDAPFGDYYTPYRIDFAGRIRERYAAGVDGFQSLQLAMKMINVELEVFAKEKNVKLTWEGDSSGKLGFDD